MRFVIINPFTQNITAIDCADVRNAEVIADLKKNGVDHGVVTPGIGIVVYEFGLFMPAALQAYFTISGRLYAGNAVLYAFNKAGETIDIERWPTITFLPNAESVERNIALGLIARPTMAANGKTIWQWPDPPLQGMMP